LAKLPDRRSGIAASVATQFAVSWEFYSMRRRVAAAAKPNPAHFAIAKLEQHLGQRFFLCTQNVDDLHEQAGSKNLVHMHGELFKSRCETCSRPPFHDPNTYDPPAELPRCNCGGRIRPHICWFGEVPFEVDRIFMRWTYVRSLWRLERQAWSSQPPVSWHT
jgi:NAD-dependent deacetylase